MQKRSVSLSIVLVLTVFALSACGAPGLSAANANAGLVKGQAQATAAAPAPAATLPPSAPSSGASSDLLAAYQGTLENLYTTVSPSVVNISVAKQVALSDSNMPNIPGFPFFNQPQTPNLPQGHPDLPNQDQPQYESGVGSGFVWDQQGHIVTNNHVVDGADKIEVTFSDGTTVPATRVGNDPDSDLAVIKVDMDAAQLHPVKLADSTTVRVGQLAIAIGNPFGLEGTMTTGIVSALGRSLPANENAVQSYTIPDVIQTDAPINPGNSGGVLVDAQGQVIGVTSAIQSSSGVNAGVGFAIPSAIVNNVVPALIQDGKVSHPWLGISGTSLVPDLAKEMNLDDNQRGALVIEVSPDSPAEKAGLKGSDKQVTIEGRTTQVGGDVITAIDGQPVERMDDLIAYLFGHTQVGQKVTLSVLRDGKEQSIDVTLAARPAAQESAQASSTPTRRGVRLGINALTVDENIIKEMNLDSNQQGVLVVEVQPGSPAEAAGLKVGTQAATINGQQVMLGGDIITAVNGQAVTSLEALRGALSQLPADQELTLTVLRNGNEIDVTVNPGQ